MNASAEYQQRNCLSYILQVGDRADILATSTVPFEFIQLLVSGSVSIPFLPSLSSTPPDWFQDNYQNCPPILSPTTHHVAFSVTNYRPKSYLCGWLLKKYLPPAKPESPLAMLPKCQPPPTSLPAPTSPQQSIQPCTGSLL